VHENEDLNRVHHLIDDDRGEFLQILHRLVAQPSISARNEGVAECAELLCQVMREMNITSRIIPTEGQPVVYGEIINDPNAYTLLCYGHYDVQPPEPLEQWESPPFEPEVRGGRIYGRGVGDNKGQLLAHVLAAAKWLEACGSTPVNVKFVFEGEEESGSPNLRAFVRENAELLRSDLVYISDGGMHPSGNPTLSLGNRGILGVSLIAEEADRDNHSGNKGGAVPNPVWTLLHLLASTVHPSGEVLIDGFYDDVRPITETEESLLADLPFDRQEMGSTMGLEELNMDACGYYRRIMLRPYFNISGFSSGYVGPGSKTIIPGRAECRIDIRLVADQKSSDIAEKLQAHVAHHAPHVRVNVGQMGSMEASRTSPDHPAVPIVSRAIRAVHEVQPYVLPAGGGSLPNAVWPEDLGTAHIGVPYANADEHNHSPNENLRLDCFFRGIHTSAQLMWEMARARQADRL